MKYVYTFRTDNNSVSFRIGQPLSVSIRKRSSPPEFDGIEGLGSLGELKKMSSQVTFYNYYLTSLLWSYASRGLTGWISGLMHEHMNGWTNERTKRSSKQANEQKKGQTDEGTKATRPQGTKGRRDERTKGRRDERMNVDAYVSTN